MRWHDLFADLESQAEAWHQGERDAEIAERSRAEQSTISLSARLAAASGSPVTLQVLGVGEVAGVLASVGADWLLLSHERTERLVLLAALAGVRDLDRRAQAPQARSEVLARLGVAAPLRAIARDRSTVLISLRDGAELTGTLERVGEDYLDVTVHDVEDTARGAKRTAMTLPFAAVAQVRTTPSGWA